jgi:hypothetical protein
VRLFFVALLAFAGCTSAPKGERYCQESVAHCATAMDCARDAKRDCILCACRAWDDTKPRSGGAGNAVPEESRPPPPARSP